MSLSPGKWHVDVPRTLVRNLQYRRDLLALAKNDRTMQRRIRQVCRDDILFYINSFVLQFNPSKAKEGNGVGAMQPFITYPFQERFLLARPETHREYAPYDRGFLWCYENDKTMACEKSRWMGASWLQLIVQDWLSLFHENVQVLNISKNEDAVDNGTRDSLFWKLRHMHERLPFWITGEIEESKLYFHYHSTSSEAIGTATTAKAGVGGRCSFLNVDEFPEIDKGSEIRQKTALTANCRLFTGTHLGVGTEFHRMCDPKQNPEIVRWRMHWSEHPEHAAGMYEFNPSDPTRPIIHDPFYKYPSGFQFILDGTPTGGPRPGVRSPWYDQKCLEMGDARAVAMNLDISPEGSAKQFFDGLKIRNIITESARSPVWVGDVQYDRDGKLQSIHETAEGRLKLWVRPKSVGVDAAMPTSIYHVGADVAAGTGATPSCLAGIDAQTSTKVMEYSNPFIVEDEFAKLTMAVCELLCGARLVWDSSGQQGVKFEQSIIRLGYSNIYYNDDDLTVIHQGRATRRPGWYSSNSQKYAVLVDYRNALYDRRLIDRSEECLLETLLFEYDRKSNAVQHAGEVRTNDPSGARKNHGDMVIATAIAWMLAKEHAEGGRRAAREEDGRPEPNTLEWMLELERMRERMLEEYV